MKKYISLAAMLFVLSMCAAPLWAQMEGSVRGVAKDQSGKPIAGATVQISDPQTGRKYNFKTNSKGEYSGIGVYIGTYKFTLTQNGTEIDEHANVPIAAGQDRVVDFDMAIDRGSGPSEEQKKQMEQVQKQNEKIKGLNAQLTKAKELEGAGNFDEAISVLTQATQADPSQDLIWAYLGDAQRGAGAHATDAAAKTKYYQDAVTSYQKALAIKQNYGPYMGQLAEAYNKAGQPDKALEEDTAAAQADPTNAATYYFHEGAVLTNTGKVDDAIAAFNKTIELDPKKADAYYWKGVNLIGKATMKDNKMVAPDGTAEAFNKYLELQPTGKYADASKQMLASIGSSVDTSYKSNKASTGTKKK